MQIHLFLLIVYSFYNCEASLCDGCREILTEFNRLFEESAAGSFGGGNTHWEETHQGSFHTSEVRLMEILESLYASKRQENGVLSKIEEYIETWWSRDFRSGRSTIDSLEQFVCINETKFCCPWNKYGNACLQCSPCLSYGGSCDGNGSRMGSGDCVCLSGYTGPSCSACNLSTHFPKSDQETGSLRCILCHQSCSEGCSGDGPEHCTACNAGWRRVKAPDDNLTEVCVDVNECEESPYICPSGTFCVNEDGFHDCKKCSHPCASCTGAAECSGCVSGYVLSSDTKCLDIDECQDEKSHCQGENEKCVNTPGSFRCDCEEGFSRISGKCSKRKLKPGTSDSQSKKQNIKQKPKMKTIWTIPYTLEFLKFISFMAMFAFLLFYFSDRIFLCLTIFIVALAYICYQSTILDFVFSRPS